MYETTQFQPRRDPRAATWGDHCWECGRRLRPSPQGFRRMDIPPEHVLCARCSERFKVVVRGDSTDA